MPHSRREFLLAALPALATLAGCGRPGGEEVETEVPFAERLAQARERGADFLVERQSDDGAWRSDTYGTFKDGTALTPLALNALLAASPERQGAIRKAADYLAAFTRPGGQVVGPSYGFDFALYTAALTVTALSHPRSPRHRSARDTWLRFLKQRQLTEDLGWSPGDREYGGWGYSRSLPRKSRPGELILPLTESNLSATTAALDALHSAGVSAGDPAFARALTFVRRCQNWEEDADRREPAFDDGGFFFIYDDPVRNKAGVAGTDRSGRQRYHSYGSATADGFRCLIRCGVPESDPRPQAARAWLTKHFQAGRHPGTYAKRREADRMGVYHYYAASLARAPSTTLMVEAPGGPLSMKRLLAGELLQRQQRDGSWSNPAHAMREDDLIVATSLALIALQ
jgi:hypothetical protein